MASLLGAAGCGGGSVANSGTSATTPQSAASPASTLHRPVQSIPAGDEPHDLVVAAGRIWVADFGGPVREFDLRGHQLRKVGVDAQSLAAGPGGVWAGELSNSNSGPEGPFAEVDARTGRVARRLTTQHSVDLLAVGGSAVWVAPSAAFAFPAYPRR
jgi:hypothetical protein